MKPNSVKHHSAKWWEEQWKRLGASVPADYAPTEEQRKARQEFIKAMKRK